jgi:type II secretory pathway pseudopilin PulG
MNDRHEFCEFTRNDPTTRLDVTQFVTIRVIGVVTALVVPLFIAAMQVQAQTQSAMNAQARADFQRADADLNKTYRSVLAKLPTVESKQKLREAQRA